MRKKMIGF